MDIYVRITFNSDDAEDVSWLFCSVGSSKCLVLEITTHSLSNSILVLKDSSECVQNQLLLIIAVSQ